MEWIDRLNDAMAYLEAHLTGEIAYEVLAQKACCSVYHFQRMFSYMAGMPLSEYIRRRRMSLAAVDLKNREVRVLDVALKYGYESPTAFTRAFQNIHGITPSKARDEGVEIKAFPAISFKIIIKGEAEMTYRIEKKEPFRMIGISHPLLSNIEENFEIVPGMWQKMAMDGTVGHLVTLMDAEPKAVLGVSVCNELEAWRYYIGVASSADIGDAYEAYTVPEATWAIFPGKGNAQSIQMLEKRIVTEWLPTSGYEYANAPDIEVYFNADPENALYEVWIPVMKKPDEK
ncbi:AraC family transcriptional regulator [Fusibacter paucivorans]|uniref:AraC family transcriptional regulator n=1 Tax=Fusibacter paucivorans TaxID=76009 RepID=A0ABS5PTC3_9FIRM|nr:AraC family transcriptional regulator [Fusibacter paucivorans]MBS7527629.1 AraC family transcriptional regulator [Fusibacter paucivorans]